MELFHGVNIDWLGKKWYFLGFSLIFSIAGIAKMGYNWVHTVDGIHTPVPLGIDFRGGTQVQVVGLARIGDDVTPELASAAIESVTVLGAFQASPAVRRALAGRIR